ncbi:hypothetical protein EVAR_77744_1 [Eumeta japonica]|uniref:Uncharacterized protein n=1 Tax=Eumeta variegata TaxID=151549 RepID=A0A4C1TE90_EUMVA|nr:hypothetical protein EVAR_77744_1 [Eumeta japonica]
MRDPGSEGAITPRTISIDAISVSFETGGVVNQLGCIKASELHEFVVYEDRGEKLNYFLQRDPTNTVNTVDTWGYPITSKGLSGSKRLQQRITEDKKAELEDRMQRAHKQNSESNERIRAFLGVLGRDAKSLPGAKYLQRASTSQAKKKKPTVPINPKTAPTRAQRGEVNAPAPLPGPIFP